MKKIIARVLSFFLDLMLLTLVVGAITILPIFDSYTSEISLLRQEALQARENYEKIDNEIDDILNDALVTDEEFNYIHTNFISYRVLFDDIEANMNISKEYIDNIHDNIDKVYKDIYNDQLFEAALANRYQNIVAIVVYILYFGVLQYILKGQTIFKKLFRIRVVDNKDVKLRVPLWKFVLRTVLICEIIFITIDLIAISNLDLNNYLTFNGIMGNIKYLYEVLFVLMIILRDDQRSIHDFIFNTRVVRYDKFGKIQEDVLFKLDDDKSEVNNKKQKEEVKAIKVND